jgi:hypothetical protein
VDAIAYSKSVLGQGFPWVFVLPGIAATLALIFMNLISREELAEMSDDAYDEGAAVRCLPPLSPENPSPLYRFVRNVFWTVLALDSVAAVIEWRPPPPLFNK